MMDLEKALELAIQSGTLIVATPYSKVELIRAFLRIPSVDRQSADELFSQLRSAATQSIPIGKLAFETTGINRGRRYAFQPFSAAESHEISEASPSTAPISRSDGAASETASRTGSKAKVDVYFGDNLPLLRSFPDQCFDLIYIDPPFNTGKTQTLRQMKVVRDEANGDRVGFEGKRYRTLHVGSTSFADAYDDFLAFLEPRLREAQRLLTARGSFFLHIDYREVHYCKVLLDTIFGRDCFVNEIIWAYDYGARSKNRWSTKHDNILWYVKDPGAYTFNFDEMDRIPYMAPGLVGKEKAARGKTPTDVWWHTIVPTNGKERTGYPTQKPLGILSRILKVHSLPGDRVLDFFAGSGTTGEAAVRLDRSAVLIDSSEEAIKVMRERLSFAVPDFHNLPSSLAIEADASGSEAPNREPAEDSDPAQASLF